MEKLYFRDQIGFHSIKYPSIESIHFNGQNTFSHMSKIKRKILVTHALPYANGPLHLGHMVEHVQGDIWVRFQRLSGHEIHLVCAEDAHGTPIMLKAKNEGITPEELIEAVALDHKRDFDGFRISFDNYHTTHSPENREFAETIFGRLKEAGYIVKRTIMQAFDEQENIFLPDRFIKGQCPNCKTDDQYGDNCENCGATYSPTELLNPKSVLSGKTPIEKESEHYFFTLNSFRDFLKNWTQDPSRLQKQASNKLNEWFEAGLQDWDISRDAPYFGFNIPNTQDKFFYVWLDAPIGYMASFKNYCNTKGLDFDEYWRKDSKTELYHIIGKDILYFHALFWPAMLEGSGYRTPTSIFAHGFLTVNGEKMSKSRGTFIQAKTYLDHFDADYIRYYFAAKLNSQIEDIDLNLDDFVARVNADLIGKLVNIASRCAGFINKRFDHQLAGKLENKALFDQLVEHKSEISKLYENRQYSQAIRLIMSLADIANQYIDEQQPWVLAKQDEQKDKLHLICTQGVNFYKLLIMYLSPVVPDLAKRSEDFLNCSISANDGWQALDQPLLNHKINKYKHLMKRIEMANVEKMLVAEKQSVQASAGQVKDKTANSESESEMISIDDFAKVDMRIARIVTANSVEGADKLLQLTLDIGDETRNVFAGIKSAYTPQQLEGKFTVMVANLAPRKMRFGVSEGNGARSRSWWAGFMVDFT